MILKNGIVEVYIVDLHAGDWIVRFGFAKNSKNEFSTKS